MRIFVELTTADGSGSGSTADGSYEPPEWLLVETQGEILPRDAESLDGLPMGHVQIDGKKAELLVGQHELKGSVVALEKPFAVLERIEEPALAADRDADDPMGAQDVKKSVRYQVKAIIKKKVLFNTRPKPLIVKVE